MNTSLSLLIVASALGPGVVCSVPPFFTQKVKITGVSKNMPSPITFIMSCPDAGSHEFVSRISWAVVSYMALMMCTSVTLVSVPVSSVRVTVEPGRMSQFAVIVTVIGFVARSITNR